MPEMPHACEHHRHAMLIGSSDYFIVAHWPTGLDNTTYACSACVIYTVAEGEESIRTQSDALELRKPQITLSLQERTRNILDYWSKVCYVSWHFISFDLKNVNLSCIWRMVIFILMVEFDLAVRQVLSIMSTIDVWKMLTDFGSKLWNVLC